MKISTRLSLLFLATAILAVVLAAFFFSRVSMDIVQTQYRDAVRDSGRLLLPQARRWLSEPDSLLDQRLDEAAAESGMRVTLISPDGVVLADTDRSGADLARMEIHGDRPEVRAAMEGEVVSNVRISATLGIPFLYLAHPVVERGYMLGVLRLAVPLTSVRELENLRTRYLGAGIAAVLAASLMLAAFLNSWFLRPMSRLQTAASAIAHGDYDRTIEPLGAGEIGELGVSVQRIADSLRDTIRRLESDRRVHAAVFGALQEGVIALDASGTVVVANETVGRLLDDSGDLAGRDVVELFRQPEVTGLVSGLLSRGQGGEARFDLEGPARRTLRVSALPVREHAGSLVGILVLSDITTYLTTLRMRRDFLSNASHELRTPLTSILGYLETLEEQVPADSPLRTRYIDVLVRQAERMHRIIDDLLLLAQIESDQWPVRREPYDITAQAEQILESFRPAASKNGQHLVLATPPVRSKVNADREKIHVVISNLLDNALKYSGQGSHIEVSLRCAGHEMEVAVWDDGPGIPRDKTQRVFERFYRLDKSRSRALGGTGLGLSIVRNILAAHDTEIGVDSDLGEGARFAFRLPLAADPAAPTEFTEI